MFEVKITTLREFLIFVKIIRNTNNENDELLIKELTKDLNETSDSIQKAVDNASKT